MKPSIDRHAAAARRDQRGATLLESLVAFAFVALGAVGAGEAARHLRAQADTAARHGDAIRIAHDALEAARSFVVAGSASGSAGYADLADRDAVVDGRNTTFRVATRVVDGRGDKQLRVEVAWDDRRGAAQRAVVDGIVAGALPAHSAALALAGSPGHVALPFRRATSIAPVAAPRGDGRSAWRPAPGDAAGVALVLDDATGDVVGHCRGVDVALADLAAADLSACTAGRWRLVSGVVRFAGGGVRPLAVALTLEAGGYAAAPMCQTDALRTVRYLDAAGATRLADVALAADAASALGPGARDVRDSGDAFVAWRCLVVPDGDGRWAGRVDIVPDGWSIGADAAAQRVCRHASRESDDFDVDGAGRHTGIARSIATQNFLVVRGDADCAHAGPAAGALAPHQP